jgi:hypothetical protein
VNSARDHATSSICAGQEALTVKKNQGFTDIINRRQKCIGRPNLVVTALSWRSNGPFDKLMALILIFAPRGRLRATQPRGGAAGWRHMGVMTGAPSGIVIGSIRSKAKC